MSPEPEGNRILTDENVRTMAVDRLGPLLSTSIQGYSVDNEMLLDALVYAAAEGTSLHGACDSLAAMADDNTLRDYLNLAFPADSVYALNQEVNRLLLSDLPPDLKTGRHHLAIDLKDFPYYGRSRQIEPWVCRNKRRAGTTRFLRIATAYLMLDGLRLNLAVQFVHPAQRLARLVLNCVTRVRFAGIGVATLWLDRGFSSTSVIRAIEALRIPAVIACSIRGKPEGKGTRALCRGRCTYSTHHTFNSRRDGSCSVPMAVVRSYVGGKRKPKQARWFLYIQVGIRLPPRQIHRLYRLRFGIETSYRLMNQVRPRTTSRNPAVRFLLAAIGLLLVNVWVSLRYATCRLILPPRGFRRKPVVCIDEPRLRLRRLKTFIRHAVEARYGFVSSIQLTPDSP